MAVDDQLLFLAHQLLKLLRDLDLKYYTEYEAVADELRRLLEDVSFVHALVQDEGFQQIGSHDFKSLLGELVDPISRSVPLVQNMYSAGIRIRHIFAAIKVLACFSSSSLRRITKEFKELAKTVHEMVIKIRDDETFRELRQTHWLVFEEEVVGRSRDKAEIIELILSTYYRNFRVIPVVGMQGIGKTTFARIVYNDYQIHRTFELRLWVFVGNRGCTTRKTVIQLLEGAGVFDNRDLETDYLQKRLQTIIKGKRCFIVMDEMGDDSLPYWRSIKNLLMVCAKGTRVLLTTRSEQVAQITREDSVQPYRLNGLSGEDSWDLLTRNVFTDGVGEEEVQKWRRIVAKCEGVPFSVLAVSRVLRDKVRSSVITDADVEDIIRDEMRKKDLVADAEWRQTHSFVPQDVVVGRDEEKKAIVEELMKENSDENPLVIPIVGIAGLGKTALAQLIFNDQMVACHFDLKIWVCVTDVFNATEITEKMIQSINCNDPKGVAWALMDISLRREIGQKRYLLVLDDVWNEDEDEWNKFMEMISVGADGSRIIVTTRSKRVAKITSKGRLRELKVLDEHESWSLFQKVAFKEGEQPTNPRVMEIGKEIVNKCGGIPLVIRSIGSILFSKNPETDWLPFCNRELSEILENEAGIFASLRLSYDNLPSALQKCFCYCALFPKDYEFDVQALITLWMSQGWTRFFLEEDLEDVGYDYFMDLLRRSFFQETAKDESGKITKCKMQNLMHDLARNVAGEAYVAFSFKEENFDEAPRHVSFDYHLDSSWQIPLDRVEPKSIRSLLLPKQFRWPIEGKSSGSVCDVILNFKSLVTLDLHNSGIKVLPSTIGELKHLCYLDLSQNVNIKTLPNSIRRLKRLQILKLNYCTSLQTLPKDITKLYSLRYLENESCYCLTHMPRGMHELHGLRKLSEFVLRKSTSSVLKQSGKLDELRCLNSLGDKLKIKNLRSPEDDKTAEANLYQKDLLSLMLIWDISTSVNQADCEKALEDLRPQSFLRELSLSAYGGCEFSSWLPSLSHLVKLSLSRCNSCLCLPPLHGLYRLKVLIVDELMKLQYISDKTSMKREWIPFSSLKELRLTSLPELKGWWKDAPESVEEEEEEEDEEEEEEAFTCLSKLVVEDCPSLTSLPLFPCLDELLKLKNTSWTPFQRTMAAKKVTVKTFEASTSSASSASSTSSTSSTSFTAAPLSQLRTLYIISMTKGDSNMWQSLPGLRSVTFDHVTDIDHELEGLQIVTSLQQIHIWRCDRLKEIPSWIDNSKSINTISIKLCPKLKIPRERLSLIATIKRVEIEDCPKVSYLESMLKDPLFN